MKQQILQVSETPMKLPVGTFIDPNIRHVPCPVCGYKKATIEEFDRITKAGKEHVRQIRCKVTKYDPLHPMRQREGCGAITPIIETAKPEQEEVEMSRPYKITEQDIKDMTLRSEEGEIKQEIFREYAEKYDTSVSSISAMYYKRTADPTKTRRTPTKVTEEVLKTIHERIQAGEQVKTVLDEIGEELGLSSNGLRARYYTWRSDKVNSGSNNENPQEEPCSLPDISEISPTEPDRHMPIFSLIRNLIRQMTMAELIELEDNKRMALEVLAR
mgnify:CR=1 FL=1